MTTSAKTWPLRLSPAVPALAAALALAGGPGCSEARAARTGAAGLVVDSTFWSQWGDGKAELAGYRTSFRRYGALREGTAVTVFVTEDFSNALRVKADPGQHPASDVFPVMKLNLVQDFQTGIYDYNLMTSVFVGLAPFAGLPAGFPAKVSFSSQEWCGHTYQQWLFDPGQIRSTGHSYFDGEADQIRSRVGRDDGFAGDAQWHWARGFALPEVAAGQKVTVPYLPPLQTERLEHREVDWTVATLSQDAAPVTVTVPAGTFTTVVRRVQTTHGPDTVFYVEQAAPRRIIKWTQTDGAAGVLLGSKRLPYWELHDNGHERHLADIGLAPPPAAPR